MAQNVESIVNIKATADTSDASKKLTQLSKLAEQMAEEFKKADLASADFSDSIDRLSSGYSALDNSTQDVSKNINNIGKESQGSTMGINELSKTLGSLANGGNISANTFTKFAETLGMTGGELAVFGASAGVAIAGIKLITDNTKELISVFKNVGSAIGESALDGIEWFIDSLEDMADMLEDCMKKLQDFADLGVDIQNSYIGLGNFIGTDALAGISEYANQLEKLTGLDATGIVDDMNKMGGAIAELGASSEQLEDISKTLYEFALNLHGYNPSTSTTQAIEEITKALQTGKINAKTNKALFNLLGQDGVEAFNNLGSAVEKYNFILEKSASIQGAYQKYLETDAGKIEILKQQYSSLLGNIGQVALHLYAVVAPILTQILQLANGVLSALMKVFNINVQTSTGISGTGGLGGIKNNLDEISKSAGKATKQLASFDDVIQINENKAGGAIGNVDVGGLNTLSSILPELIDQSKDLEDAWANFKELMSEGNWLGAGKEFMQVLADQLRKIPWDEIKTKAAEAGIAISDFLNGIFSTDLNGTLAWKTLGETLGESFNTVITFSDNFLTNLNFSDIGKSLGTAWTSLWETLDTESAGHALYEAFTGVFELALGFLQNGGLNKAATALSEIITSFFTSFTDVDLNNIADTVEGIVDDIITSLETIVNALTSDDVKRVVLGLIERIVTAFKENAGEWGTALHDIANNVLDFIIEAIDTADKAGLNKAISTFLDKLKLGELVSKWMQIKWKLWTIKFKAEAGAFFKVVGDFLLKALKDLGLIIVALLAQLLLYVEEFAEWLISSCVKLGEKLASWLMEGTAWIGNLIGNLLGTIIGQIAGFGINVWESLNQIGSDIVNWLVTGISDILNKISTFLSDIIGKVKTWGSDIISGITEWGSNVWSKIESIGKSIGEKFSSIGENIKSVFSGIWDFISDVFDPQKWVELGTAALNALWKAIKSLWNNTIGKLKIDIPGFAGWDGIHISVPKLATGGIVTSATTALIGEAGKEAVLPLENNTQWMDKLAAKINNNGGGNTNGGTVNVQLTDKPFYTRSEMYEFGSLVVESLKAYGLNIAMV